MSVFCINCSHYHLANVLTNGYGAAHRCYRKDGSCTDYVTGIVSKDYEWCCTVNSRGDCPDFREKCGTGDREVLWKNKT